MGKGGQVMGHSGADKARCLVMGSNGLVGSRIAGIMSAKNIPWVGTCNKRPREGMVRLDITDHEAVRRLLLEVRPEAVFDCANLAGGVDHCERNPDIARAFHLDSTINIGSLCASIGAKMFFISTDYVFDGTRGPYKEDDATNPLNLYGRIKLSAEKWISENLKDGVTVRTTNVYGWDPDTVTPNYMMSVYRALKEGKTINAPSYLWGNPTYADDLAAAIVELYLKKAAGLFHIVGSSFVNRYEWAVAACDEFGLDKGKIIEVKDPPSSIVPRPLRSWLDNGKFKRSCKTGLNDMRSGLRMMKKEMFAHA